MDLKEYKRISTDNGYRDIVQISDDEPRFRQNGYQCNFLASNNDFLIFNNPTQINTTGAINFKLTTSNMVNPSAFQLFSVGTTGIGEGLLSIYFLNTGLIIIDIFDNTGTQVVNVNGGIQSNLDDLIEWTFDGVKLYRDGLQIIDLTSFGTINVNISTARKRTKIY